MKTVFADTSFYIALLNQRDEHHQQARQFADEYPGDFVTSAWIVTELADYLCNTANRNLFLSIYGDLRADARVTIVPFSTDLFDRGIELYAARPDKDWSLTDCVSFLIMRQLQLHEAAAADHHFVQAGFAALLAQKG
jgi:uncharacterized protein